AGGRAGGPAARARRLVLRAQSASLRHSPGRQLEPPGNALVVAAGLPHRLLLPGLRRIPAPARVGGLPLPRRLALLELLGRRLDRRSRDGRAAARVLELALGRDRLLARAAGERGARGRRRRAASAPLRAQRSAARRVVLRGGARGSPRLRPGVAGPRAPVLRSGAGHLPPRA